MTTTVRTLTDSTLYQNALLTRVQPVSLTPGETLTQEQTRELLLQSTAGTIVPRPGTSATDNVILSATNNAGSTAGNGDTVVSDPQTVSSGVNVTNDTGFSAWISNNPVYAGGIALIVAWALYEMFKRKR